MRTGPHFWNAPCSECAGRGRNPGGFLFPVKNIHGTRREGGQHRFRIAEGPCRDSQRAVSPSHSHGRRSGISLRNQMVQHVFPAFRFNDVKKSRCRSSQRRNRPALALRAVLLKTGEFSWSGHEEVQNLNRGLRMCHRFMAHGSVRQLELQHAAGNIVRQEYLKKLPHVVGRSGCNAFRQNFPFFRFEDDVQRKPSGTVFLSSLMSSISRLPGTYSGWAATHSFASFM